MSFNIEILFVTMVLLSDISLIQSQKHLTREMSTRVAESVELSCSSQAPWFFCVWEGPTGDRVCSLRSSLGKGGGSMCGESDRLKLNGMLKEGSKID